MYKAICVLAVLLVALPFTSGSKPVGALVSSPLAPTVGLNYTSFGPYTGNSLMAAVLLKSSPTFLHTAVLNTLTMGQNNCGSGSNCYVFLLDTNSPTQCTTAFPPTAPVIAAIDTNYGVPTSTLTYDVATTSGLCVFYNPNANVTLSWR